MQFEPKGKFEWHGHSRDQFCAIDDNPLHFPVGDVIEAFIDPIM